MNLIASAAQKSNEKKTTNYERNNRMYTNSGQIGFYPSH